MTKSVVCILIAILVYMGMMVVIGAVYSKKNSSVGDFYLGRPAARTGGFCHECRGFGHEQLSAHGSAGAGVSERLCRGRLDCLVWRSAPI